MSVELVADDEGAARQDRCSAMFQLALEQKMPLEDIEKRSIEHACRAEALGNDERRDDFLLIASWASEWIRNRDEAIGQGRQVSDRLASEGLRRRDLQEAAVAIQPEFRKIGPGIDELKRRRNQVPKGLV